ncbi:MAG: hypothetical protein LBS90_04020, partial [Oscillospiraceae bacterium]|nr:hypothetical protein [Oscillospiraceae bacterium]
MKKIRKLYGVRAILGLAAAVTLGIGFLWTTESGTLEGFGWILVIATHPVNLIRSWSELSAADRVCIVGWTIVIVRFLFCFALLRCPDCNARIYGWGVPKHCRNCGLEFEKRAEEHPDGKPDR